MQEKKAGARASAFFVVYGGMYGHRDASLRDAFLSHRASYLRKAGFVRGDSSSHGEEPLRNGTLMQLAA